jgi:hypothetical protein
MGHRRAPRLQIVVFLLAAAVLWPAAPRAHEIPADVLIQAFVRPEGQRLQLLVRMPLATMRDVLFPETPDGFLDLNDIEPRLLVAARLWIVGAVAIHADGAPVGPLEVVRARISLPSDRSFVAWPQALSHIQGDPLPVDTKLVWNQALIDVLMEAPIASDRARFSIEPLWARLGLRVTTVLRFVPPDGTARGFVYSGDPGLVQLDPTWQHAAGLFIRMRFTHILGGIDHLLFLLCLVAPFRRAGPLVLIVTAFTVAHSITLVSAALGAVPDRLWFPPLIETLIAASIVFMAIENIVMAAAGTTSDSAVRRRWVLTFLFGLVHGFGFSFSLGESLQFAGSHLAVSLAMFNFGVELGQLSVLAVMVPALALVFRYVCPERVGVIILSALVTHTAWHWMTERGTALGEYSWTADDVRLLADVVRWALLVVSGAAAAWLGWDLLRRRGRKGAPTEV